MTLPKILVTGATGKTGGAVVAELCATGHPVRAMVRIIDERSRRLEAMGAEVAVADMYDPDQLLDAMRGTQRAYFLPVFEHHMMHSAAAFMVAAREARLEQIVQMSQWLSSATHPASLTRQVWLADQIMPMIPNTSHTLISPGMFADNFLRVLDFAVLLGLYPVLSGHGKAAPVSNEDMAKVSAAVLTGDPALHDAKRYRPTGPRALCGSQMAGIIRKVVRHPVIPVRMPFFMFLKVARMQRVNPFELSCYRYYMEEMKRGTFALDGGVNDVVRELTGAPAETFETTVRRYAAMPFARPTLSNRLKAFINFGLTPFYPGYDLDRWDRRVGLSIAGNPKFAIDDPLWREQHAAGPA